MASKAGRSNGRMTRRQFLTGAAAAAGCLAVSGTQRLLAAPAVLTAQARVLTTSDPRVVHVYNPDATSWNYATGWWGDHVSQVEVTRMVDRGLMTLTGTASRAAAWQVLIPAYVPGQRVAIKVNFNNAASLDDADNVIDALIEPVNSVVAGLKEIGVVESDIWVFDAVRSIPDRFRRGCDYPGVQFSGRDFNNRGFSDTERVVFEPPPGAPPLADQHISQVLVDAHYLINMPIMKKHSHAYVTLSFKNHFGTIHDCAGVHEPTFPDWGGYWPAYSPMVDIYQNPHFVGKTVLTIGDGLFANRISQSSPPVPWVTFGNKAPNSLFFSLDPVAIDCVMYDFLEAEAGVPATADDYLLLANQAGLGTFEHRAPGVTDPAGWYSLIDYVYLDLTWVPNRRLYMPLVQL